VPGLAVASFPSVASVLAVAPAGVGMCVAFGGVAVVAPRTLVACCVLADTAVGAASPSVGGSGRLVVINILLQAEAFGSLVVGCCSAQNLMVPCFRLPSP
jgi:hypothetical protein